MQWGNGSASSLIGAAALAVLLGPSNTPESETESRLYFRVMSDAGDAVVGLPVLVEDPDTPAGMDSLVLWTDDRGVTGHCLPPPGSTYIAHLSEYESSAGFYCGSTYLVDIPVYPDDLALGVYRQVLSHNRLDRVPLAPCSDPEGITVYPAHIEPFWMLGITPVFEGAFDLWIGPLYHDVGISRFLAYYGVGNRWTQANRGVVLRTRHTATFEGALLISVSTLYTSMAGGGVMPRVRALAIVNPKPPVAPLPADGRIVYVGFLDDNVWLELEGGLRGGYTILLLEPGDGTDYTGTEVPIEGCYQAVVPAFSAFEGGGDGWVSRRDEAPGAGSAKEHVALPRAPGAGIEKIGGDPADEGLQRADCVSHAARQGEDPGADCMPQAPRGVRTACDPTPGWFSTWYFDWERVTPAACQVLYFYNRNLKCVKGGPDDDPPKQRLSHTSGYKVTVGGSLGKKDAYELTPSYEYTTESEEEMEFSFNTGAHGQGQCRCSFTFITICVATWKREVSRYRFRTIDDVFWTPEPDGTYWLSCQYRCEEEYISWQVCDRTDTK